MFQTLLLPRVHVTKSRDTRQKRREISNNVMMQTSAKYIMIITIIHFTLNQGLLNRPTNLPLNNRF